MFDQLLILIPQLCLVSVTADIPDHLCEWFISAFRLPVPWIRCDQEDVPGWICSFLFLIRSGADLEGEHGASNSVAS